MRIISYDKSSGTLDVDFLGELRYTFFDISSELFEAMQHSEFPQEFFNAHIWGNKFEHMTHWPSLEALLQIMEKDMYFDIPATVHSRRGDGDSPLHVACVWGDIEAVNLLLAGGADPNARGDLGCTPIYEAVSFGHLRCVELLLRAGATTNDENELGITAKKRGIESKNQKMVALFSSCT